MDTDLEKLYNEIILLNDNYSDKWFYAFIDRIEYTNQNCARIYFTIDPMQTWLPEIDYELGSCFVERAHAETDQIGDNLVDEGLDIGEYLWGQEVYPEYYDENNVRQTLRLEECSLVIAMAVECGLEQYLQNEDYTAFKNSMRETITADYWGNYNVSGLNYVAFPNNEYGMAVYKQVLSAIQDNAMVDQVFSIFWFPTALLDFQNNGSAIKPGFIPITPIHDPSERWGNYGWSTSYNVSVPSDFGTIGGQAGIDGYVPKNNKL